MPIKRRWHFWQGSDGTSGWADARRAAGSRRSKWNASMRVPIPKHHAAALVHLGFNRRMQQIGRIVQRAPPTTLAKARRRQALRASSSSHISAAQASASSQTSTPTGAVPNSQLPAAV